MKAESRQIPQQLAARLKFVYCKLGNVTVLTATSAIAASNAQPRYSDELTFTLTQKL